MFGKAKSTSNVNSKPIDIFTARRIAEAMNCWAGKEHRREIITPRKLMQMTPVVTHEADGMLIYAYQWGDVTILANVRTDGYVTVKHTCW